MLSTLLSKVSNILEKDFLFGSLLPALVFIAAVLVTFAGITGTLSTVAVAESWPARALWTTLLAILIVLVAFVLKGLRPLQTGLWTGREELPLSPLLPLRALGERRERARLDALEKVARADRPWLEMRNGFIAEMARRDSAPPAASEKVEEARQHPLEAFISGLVDKLQQEPGADHEARAPDPPAETGAKPAVPEEEVAEALEAVRSLESGDIDSADEALGRVYRLYDDFDVSNAASLWRETDRHLRGLADSEGFEIQEALGRRDREFGVGPKVRATRLGNVIDAYQHYSFTRYRMEAEIFWTRLVAVVESEDLALVDDRRVVLDFALTSTSLTVGYAALVLLLGPWAWSEVWWLWAALAGAGILAARLCYALAVSAAIQLGESLRAAFDLHRLDLLAALGGGRPTSLKEERKRWEKLSQLAVYGGDGLKIEIEHETT